MYLRFNKIISFLYQGHLKVKLAFFFLHGMHGCEEYDTCDSLLSLT